MILNNGYAIESILSTAGTYKNIKGPSDTGLENTYRITKVNSNLTISIETSKSSIIDSHIPGDINDGGETNNKDLTRLFQHISNWDVTVNEAALDVNGDSAVNNKYLTRLFEYLSDWDVEIFWKSCSSG